MAIAIAFLFVQGQLNDGVSTDLLSQALILHTGIGLLVLLLLPLRIAVLRGRTLPPPDGAQPWELKASHAAHRGMYALMMMVLATGVAQSFLNPVSVRPFGLFEMALLGGLFETLFDGLRLLHVWTASVLIAVAVVHAGAALRQHFIKRTNVLSRMVPLLPPPRSR
jgi:cytochrome b561